MSDWWFEVAGARSLTTAPALLRDTAEHARYHGLLATALTVRYQRGGEPAALDEAVSTARRALDAMPTDDPDRSWVTTTLAVALASRYERSGDLAELGEALVLARGAAGADHPPVDAARGTLLAWAAHTYANGRSVEHDLRGRDFSLRDLRDTDLGGADLTGALLSHADLTGANLAGAILTGATLDHANLTNTVLSGADLTGATLTEAHLVGAHLTGATLDHSTLAETDVAVAARQSRHPEAHATVIAAAAGLVATGHQDASIRLWHAGTGTLVCEYPWPWDWNPDTGFGEGEEFDPWAEVVALTFSPDGGRLAAVRHSAVAFDYQEEYHVSLRVWHLDDGSDEFLLDDENNDLDDQYDQLGRPMTLSFSPDGRSLALGAHHPAGAEIFGAEHNVRVWHAASGARHWLLATHPDEWHGSVAHSPDSRLVAAGCVDPDFGEYSVTVGHTGVSVERWSTGSQAVLAVTFAGNDRVRAVTSGGQRWSAWEWHTGTDDDELWHRDGTLTAAAYSPDGRRLAVASGGRVALCDAASGAEVWSIAADAVTVLRFAPDGRWLAAGTEEAVRVHEAGSGTALPGVARAVAFVPNGYAAIHPDGSAHLHDLTGAVVRDLVPRRA